MAFNFVNKIICSGGLFLAAETKKFLFLLRTQGKTAGHWGFVGGKKDPSDNTPVDTLNREIEEEIGLTQSIKKYIPLEFFISNDQQFQYSTYVLLVDKEFIPVLNDEHSGYAWCAYDKWPKPLHQGANKIFNNKITRAKLELLISLI